LRRRGAPAPVAAEVLADLTARGYLDDAAFAHHWIATRSARGYGPARLRAELRARGVAGSLVDAALAAQGDDELERARAVARRRLPALQRADRTRAATRLRDHLVRRGYSAAIVSRVVRESVGLQLED